MEMNVDKVQNDNDYATRAKNENTTCSSFTRIKNENSSGTIVKIIVKKGAQLCHQDQMLTYKCSKV